MNTKDSVIIDRVIDRIAECLLPIVKIFYKHYPNNKQIVGDFMSKLIAVALTRVLNKIYPDDSKGTI